MRRRNAVAGTALAAALLSLACGGTSGPGADAEIFFPRLPPPPHEAINDVGFGGELKLEGGCLRIRSTTPIWPADYRARAEGGGVAVLDGAGRVVARTGDRVTSKGSTPNSLDQIPRLDRETRRRLEEQCPGEYWVGSGYRSHPPGQTPAPERTHELALEVGATRVGATLRFGWAYRYFVDSGAERMSTRVSPPLRLCQQRTENGVV